MEIDQVILLMSVFFYTLAFLAGASIGSAYLCFIMRRAMGESWLKGSSCDNCHTKLTWKDLVPIVSYAAYKGKCRYCGHRIPVECVIIECAFGVLGLAIALVCSVSLPVLIKWLLPLICISAITFYIHGLKSTQRQQKGGNTRVNNGSNRLL